MGGREPLGEGGRDLRMEAVALTPCAPIILSSSGAEGVSVGDGVGGALGCLCYTTHACRCTFSHSILFNPHESTGSTVILNST